MFSPEDTRIHTPRNVFDIETGSLNTGKKDSSAIKYDRKCRLDRSDENELYHAQQYVNFRLEFPFIWNLERDLYLRARIATFGRVIRRG